MQTTSMPFEESSNSRLILSLDILESMYLFSSFLYTLYLENKKTGHQQRCSEFITTIPPRINIRTILIHPTISKFKAINEMIYGTKNVSISPVEFLRIFAYTRPLGVFLFIVMISAIDIINAKETMIIAIEYIIRFFAWVANDNVSEIK